jgi:hypothetical protein
MNSSTVLMGFAVFNLQFSVKCFVDHWLSFLLFLFVIVLSVLLRFTDSENGIGILKNLSCICSYQNIIPCFLIVKPYLCFNNIYLDSVDWTVLAVLYWMLPQRHCFLVAGLYMWYHFFVIPLQLNVFSRQLYKLLFLLLKQSFLPLILQSNSLKW